MEKMEAQTQSSPQPQLDAATPTTQVTQQQAPPTKASSCSKAMLFTNLVARILTFVLLLVALIVLSTDSGIIFTDLGDIPVHFQDVVAYRYVMSVIVIGFAYTLVQIGFVLYQVITGRRLCNGKAMLFFDFYADKVICGLLATGAGAGFGVTIDLRPVFPSLADYFDKGVAATSLVLIAYLFSEASQVVSSYSLPKKDC